MVPIISTDTEKRQITITSTGMKKSTKTFTYDHVFGRFSTQEDVYKQTVAPMVTECLAGYSNTCFAYGQVGKGLDNYIDKSRRSPQTFIVCTCKSNAQITRTHTYT